MPLIKTSEMSVVAKACCENFRGDFSEDGLTCCRHAWDLHSVLGIEQSTIIQTQDGLLGCEVKQKLGANRPSIHKATGNFSNQPANLIPQFPPIPPSCQITL